MGQIQAKLVIATNSLPHSKPPSCHSAGSLVPWEWYFAEINELLYERARQKSTIPVTENLDWIQLMMGYLFMPQGNAKLAPRTKFNIKICYNYIMLWIQQGMGDLRGREGEHFPSRALAPGFCSLRIMFLCTVHFTPLRAFFKKYLELRLRYIISNPKDCKRRYANRNVIKY